MKKFFLLFTISIILTNPLVLKSQVYFEMESFEHGGPSVPDGWEEVYELGTASWKYADGGLNQEGENHPASAYDGDYNALFQYYTTYVTKLVTPPIDLSGSTKPLLIFYHAMQQFADNVDELRIYFKQDPDSSWVLLKEYTSEVIEWTKREIYLPDTLITDETTECHIAFEAKSKSGSGVCIDAITVEERGIITKTLNNIAVNTATSDFIPTGRSNNPILRIDFDVEGNNGNLYLENLSIKSLNTDDNDISSSGVKLFYTEDSTFNIDNQVGTNQSFSEGTATFNSLNIDLPYGTSFIWVCYDIKPDVNHEMHAHIADAMIEANGISVSGNTFPFADKSPEGSRIIYESVFFDSFETDKNWTFNGEFARGVSQGLGSEGLFTADPLKANSGTYIIGTDLSGDYEPGLAEREDSAISPTFNAKYYKDVQFSFYRWLNMDGFDDAYIDLSTDNGTSWTNLWVNDGYVNDSKWKLNNFDISTQTDRKENIKIRFALGETDETVEAGGWNIDDVAFIGNYISTDIGIVDWLAPDDGCGYSSEEQITVTIENFAGDTIKERIPLSFSLDGGTTVHRDTTPIVTIPVGETYNYTLTNLIDLTTPGWYNNIYVTTNLSEDEDNTNNKLSKKLFIAPTYDLPLTQNFETNNGYWKSNGTNTSWEYGIPNGTVIKDASSGDKVWITNLDGIYSNSEDSYIESPCLNTGEAQMPMVEFKLKSVCEADHDGLALYYSIDNGDSWTIVPKNDPYDWNWYNNDNISALGHEGWDTSFTNWTKVKQILPSPAFNQSNLKLKFVFKSDNNAEYEGFAIDDFKMYTAPHDLGVSSMVTPFDTCEWSDTTQVKVYIENYGPTTIETGTKVPVVMDFNSTSINDTLTINEDLVPNDSVLFTFFTKVDMSYAGDYNFEIYTDFETDPYFYNDTFSNDTLYATVSVTGMPRYNPLPNIIGVRDDQPIDTTLDAQPGYTSYLWSSEVWTVDSTTQTVTAEAEGNYYVTVTNAVGCTAEDSTEVVGSRINNTLSNLTSSNDVDFTTKCERTEKSEISVRVTNNGLDDYASTDSIFLGFQLDDNEIIHDTIFLSAPLTIGSYIDFTFNDSCDLTDPGIHNLIVFHNYSKDLAPTDDTLKVTVITKGYVHIDLAYDTIYSSRADTLKLIATPGNYTNYNWNSGQNNDTITPTNETFKYIVTASDDSICGTYKDSTFIEAHDLGVTAVNSPMDRCVDDASTATNLTIEVTNYSDNVYATDETISVFYKLDDDDWVETTPQLTGGLGASSTIELTIGQINTKPTGEHTLILYTSSDIDANHANDTIEFTFNTWPNPTVDLAYDTIYTTQADTLVLVAQDGYSRYIWNNDTTNNDTLLVSSNKTRQYKVQVEDSLGCGKAMDSTMVITYNLGITTMLAPESNCTHTDPETVSFEIKNYGADNIAGGTVIPIGYVLNGTTSFNEDYILPEELQPGETRTVSFTENVDISQKDLYTFKIFIDYEFDAYRANDTLVDAIKTFGNPEIELGNDIFTTQADTVEIIANPGYITYWWNEGTENDTLKVSKLESFEYIVTVTDINGCKTVDSLNIFTYDVQADSLNSPFTTCEHTNSEIVKIGVTNYSEDTLQIGEEVEVGYRLNSGSYVSQLFNLSKTLHPDSTEVFEMTATVDLSADQVHEFKIFAKLTDIDVNIEDTTTVNVEAVDYPSFSLGADIYDVNPVGTVLNGPVGYAVYEWQDGSATTDYTITSTASKQYTLTVSDEYGCEGSDTLEVFTYNVAADTLKEPFTQCELSDAENIIIGVTNFGVDTIPKNEQIEVGYRLNSGAYTSELVNLTDSLLPDSTEFFTLANTADLSAVQTHSFKLFAKLTEMSDVETEDTVSKSVTVLKPDFDLGGPIDASGGSYTIDAGTPVTYDSYEWFDEETTTPTYTVDINNQNSNFYYAVTVTNAVGCTAVDSILVLFDTQPDLSVTKLNTPVNQCWVSGKKHPVNIEVTNSGDINLSVDTELTLGYLINDTETVTEEYELENALNADASFNFEFEDSVIFPVGDVYTFKPFVKFTNDGNATNDTLLTDNEVYISAPEVNLGAYDTVYFTDEYTITIQNADNYESYLWSTDEETSTIDITTTGTYYVTVTDSLGCEGFGQIHCINRTTGIDNLIHGNDYSIEYYPNPASERLKIEMNNRISKDVRVELINLQGQILYMNQYSRVQNTIEEINISDFSRGVYYIRFRIDDKFYIRKLMIQ